jgi:serine protease
VALRLRRGSVVGGAMMPASALELRPGHEPERVHLVAENAPAGATPRFPNATGALAHHWQLRGPGAREQARSLLASGAIEAAWCAALPAPPPDADDLPPQTPEFEQAWRAPSPEGFGFEEVRRYPGGFGEHVTIVDVEYGWDPTHEDLLQQSPTALGGVAEPIWAYHGTAVLGILGAGDNGFGVTGAAPLATVLVQHPYFVAEGGTYDYDVARAIVEALAVLTPGDVILLEQQSYGLEDEFVPVSIDPAVREAIRSASAAGVVVVEAAGNDDVDLDGEEYGGAFTEDTGVLRVGGAGSSLGSGDRARKGSNFGSSVALQAWAEDIVTTAGPPMTDLYFPDEDPRQAYTSAFGGTSGASAIVAGLVASVQSVALATRGAALTPGEVRALLIGSGLPPAAGSEAVGTQPDLRRLLRAFFVP